MNNLPKLIKHNRISLTTEIRGSSSMRNCRIGKYGYIGPGCRIQNAVVGNYVSIAPNVQIGGMEHAIHDLSTNTWLSGKHVYPKTTVIEHDAWIAADCIIKQGVIIGQGAVVGANSFVNQDVPAYAIVAGSPAKIIRFRFDESLIKVLCISDYKYSPPHELFLN